MAYEIQTRTKDGWTAYGIGATTKAIFTLVNVFTTKAEAEATIEDLRALGAEWAQAEYRAVELGR